MYNVYVRVKKFGIHITGSNNHMILLLHMVKRLSVRGGGFKPYPLFPPPYTRTAVGRSLTQHRRRKWEGGGGRGRNACKTRK
jgi:hypothetical protein